MTMNKRIAELRGDKVQPCLLRSKCYTYNAIGCDSCPTEYYKPYDTDIACAMELWDEMVKTGLMPTLKTIWIDHGEIGYRMICGDRHGETHEDYTREKAIAGAYIKWKENAS